jgi:hypothetical protein
MVTVSYPPIFVMKVNCMIVLGLGYSTCLGRFEY